MKKAMLYYLGLDIGTDSIGYAVTDQAYKLLRFKGEAMWGSGLFDEASPCQERRAFRTARRRLDRRQQRVRLLRDFFAEAISEVDPKFFVRLREAALFAEDRTNPLDNQTLFNDQSFKDADFHRRYPTVHHLILDLMNDTSAHDPRLVYIACAWLVAHRGHFLSEVNIENVAALDQVTVPYTELVDYLNRPIESEDGEIEVEPLWTCKPEDFGDILSMKIGMTAKKEKLLDLLWGGRKPKSQGDDRYDAMGVISLLCGGKVKAAKLFPNKSEEYAELKEISLGGKEDVLEEVIGELGDDGELITKMKALYDWAILRDVRKGCSCISEAKVAVYEQHRTDLDWLKTFLRKQGRKVYNKVFGKGGESEKNYTAFVYNAKGIKKASKEEFSEWLLKEMKKLTPGKDDQSRYADMIARLETCSFLPKQIDGDNRVIPHQLYQVELQKILANATDYLPFLKKCDEYGSVADKIVSIFKFRIPYFVGPLVSHDEERGKFAWMVRKREGLIRPWNFAEMVDLDKSEDEFIRKMTNTCVYVPGEDVLPAESLLYKEFALLNEINPLKISGAAISNEVKLRIVEELFKRRKKVSRAGLERFLLQENLMQRGDALSGIDETIKSNLSSYHEFSKWLNDGTLSPEDVEEVIARSTCTEDSHRLAVWIKEQPFAAKLQDADIKKISRLKFSEFGRLSRKFLSGIEFEEKATGKRGTVIDFMRQENVVLMVLLSERYTLQDELLRIASGYYAQHEMSIDERLNEMYVSSPVKRQIYRALDVVKTIKKVMGCVPTKIFVEMARGGTPEQKGKRTKSRYDQLVDLYQAVRDAEVKQVNAELDKLGDNVHNRLQADALYLWSLQLGHCAYCGKPLPIENLKSVANIDHIHPQSKVKDDSVMNNKVLCCSTCNSAKGDVYPIPDAQRRIGESLWIRWHQLGLMTDEKFRRLMRRDAFTDEELQGFINRQLVETRQTTKAVFTILQELLPETEIIAVKAGNVSDFRHEFGLVKSRVVNDLHHAKDAYLNIVVGNVYHERFTRQFFRLADGYTMKVGKLFGKGSHVENAHGLAWNGVSSLMRVKSTMARNDIHLTKYAFYAKGGFFDQMPKRPGESAVPRKSHLPVVRYGGYAKPVAAGYLLVKYQCGKKIDVMLTPIDLLSISTVTGSDEAAAMRVITEFVSSIEGKDVVVQGVPFGRKILKVNTILSLDGFPYVIRGKSGGGKMYLLGSMRPLTLSASDESYVKRLESLSEKLKANRNLVIDEEYDKVSAARNLELYKVLNVQCASEKFNCMPASQAAIVGAGEEKFCGLDIKEQVTTLLSIVQLLKTNRAGGCDLTGIGGVAKAGVLTISSKLSNWRKAYKDVRLVFSDFTGLYRTSSINLLELL